MFVVQGAPPKVEYLKKILPIIKQLGATGVMIEWEDMVPFTGRYTIHTHMLGSRL